METVNRPEEKPELYTEENSSEAGVQFHTEAGSPEMESQLHIDESDPGRKSGRRAWWKNRKLGIVVWTCFLLAFCLSAFMVVSQLVRERKDARAFDALLKQLEEDETAAPEVSESQADSLAFQTDTETDVPEQEFHRYDKLYEQNQDLFGWVSIDGTELNYPVMHTPDDPEHYLHRAFDGTNSSSGVPFLDGKCYTSCGNYIVYGHHMKNGTMFAALLDYADKEFWKKHPIIRFDTLEKEGKYEVLAAFYGKAYRVGDENVFRYYNYTDLTDETAFHEYMDFVSQSSLYDTGVTAEYGDQLLTLFTCSYHTTDGRFVVVAKEIP